MKPVAVRASTSHASVAPEKNEAEAQQDRRQRPADERRLGLPHVQVQELERSSVAAPRRNEKRRPRVSATTPVGTSKSTWPAEKNAFAANASAFDRPASSRNSVLTPQMNDAANVVRSVSVR